MRTTPGNMPSFSEHGTYARHKYKYVRTTVQGRQETYDGLGVPDHDDK
jgi:hypothetical protein